MKLYKLELSGMAGHIATIFLIAKDEKAAKALAILQKDRHFNYTKHFLNYDYFSCEEISLDGEKVIHSEYERDRE